ncbi:uncharacterized protein SAPINGB_P005404 [Magnusiomyces paraingens]|uniref:Uncharacterized protein n=1 Tax=Magnusiomyces paraingens TaxID=2606893 RepID=A0A5E8BZK2_9ASCO|nr:uncharacterized protein SAPINGB_P005404 [Saprochaete ingens]VVT56917.1 unnamed protein product [Saprochaete ingens]
MKLSAYQSYLLINSCFCLLAMSNHGNTTGVNEGSSSFSQPALEVLLPTQHLRPTKRTTPALMDIRRSPVHRQIDPLPVLDLPLDN